jgi:ATP diphosphatase
VVRLLGMDAEQTLSRANEKFERRFRAMEDALRASGQPDMQALSLEMLDSLWDSVKQQEKGT